jgi:hypothetical protein
MREAISRKKEQDSIKAPGHFKTAAVTRLAGGSGFQ